MKHVVITGSTRGIGKSMAEQFLIHGFKVTLNGISKESLSLVLPLLQGAYPGRVQGYAANTENLKEMEELFEKATETFGDIDIWINNVGVDQERQLFIDCDLSQASKIMQVNILGVMNGSQAALKGMTKQGHGYIYNMDGFGSDGGLVKKMSIYGASKSAVSYFTKALAKECEGSQVKIGRLSTGMLVTDLVVGGLEKDKEQKVRPVYNLLVDRLDEVSKFLVEGMIKNRKNNAHINWLTRSRRIGRLITRKGHYASVVGKDKM